MNVNDILDTAGWIELIRDVKQVDEALEALPDETGKATLRDFRRIVRRMAATLEYYHEFDLRKRA